MSSKASSSTPTTTTTTVRGNSRTSVTRKGNQTTTTHSVKHGNRTTTTTTVKRGGKVIRTSRSTSVAGTSSGKAKRTKATKRGAPGLCAESFWVTGGNDRLATCVPVAIANSCLIVTGYRIPDWQILALAGERSVAECLAVIGVPFRAAECMSDGVVLGVPGEHAVTVHDGAAVTWGAEISLDGLAVEEAWTVDWR